MKDGVPEAGDKEYCDNASTHEHCSCYYHPDDGECCICGLLNPELEEA